MIVVNKRLLFPVGKQLTSWKPDGKEGVYHGSETDDDNHPKVLDKVPLHGRNQFSSIGNDKNDNLSIKPKNPNQN
jgi:hypothetical protein